MDGRLRERDGSSQRCNALKDPGITNDQRRQIYGPVRPSGGGVNRRTAALHCRQWRWHMVTKWSAHPINQGPFHSDLCCFTCSGSVRRYALHQRSTETVPVGCMDWRRWGCQSGGVAQQWRNAILSCCEARWTARPIEQAPASVEAAVAWTSTLDAAPTPRVGPLSRIPFGLVWPPEQTEDRRT